MLFVRTLIALLMVASILCLAMYIATGQAVWKRRGLIVIKWTVLAALAFFAVLILERLALML